MGLIFSHFSPQTNPLALTVFSCAHNCIHLSLLYSCHLQQRPQSCLSLSFPSLEVIIHLLGIQILSKISIDICIHMYMQDKLKSRGNQVPKCTCKPGYENQAGKTRGNNIAVIYSTFDSADWMANAPKVELELWERSRSTFSEILKLRVEIHKKWTFDSRLQSWSLA